MCMKKINAEKMIVDKFTLLINSLDYACPGRKGVVWITDGPDMTSDVYN